MYMYMYMYIYMYIYIYIYIYIFMNNGDSTCRSLLIVSVVRVYVCSSVFRCRWLCFVLVCVCDIT